MKSQEELALETIIAAAITHHSKRISKRRSEDADIAPENVRARLADERCGLCGKTGSKDWLDYHHRCGMRLNEGWRP